MAYLTPEEWIVLEGQLVLIHMCIRLLKELESEIGMLMIFQTEAAA